MKESFDFPKENISGTSSPEVKNVSEFQHHEKMRSFEIEFEGQKFKFLEIQSAGSSDTLLVHLPGFGEDAEQYIVPMNILMGKSYCVLALKGYGETYSKESLMGALGQAIQLSGKQNTILHGDSFGAGVVYDLISDPDTGEFLKRNNVVGAILETPFLDKGHLHSKARLLPDKILLKGSMLFDKMRNLKSLAPQQGIVELSTSQKKSMLGEALREKTTNKKIEVPVHVVFAEKESLSDNEKIMETLQSQAEKISSNTVMSAEDNGHHIENNAYESMWQEEKKVIDGFVESVSVSSPSSKT
jgi:hypothetical protein